MNAPTVSEIIVRSAVSHLLHAVAAHRAGDLGERELLAITTAANDAIAAAQAGSASPYAAFAAKANAAVMERIAELDHGDA